VSGHLFATAAIPPGKEPPIPIEQEAGWTTTAVLDYKKKLKLFRGIKFCDPSKN
jgi:hypothetical protein